MRNAINLRSESGRKAFVEIVCQRTLNGESGFTYSTSPYGGGIYGVTITDYINPDIEDVRIYSVRGSLWQIQSLFEGLAVVRLKYGYMSRLGMWDFCGRWYRFNERSLVTVFASHMGLDLETLPVLSTDVVNKVLNGGEIPRWEACGFSAPNITVKDGEVSETVVENKYINKLSLIPRIFGRRS